MKAPRIALSLTWLLNLSRSLLRRLLYIWIKSTVVPKDLNPYLTGNRGSSSKVCYVLRAKWFIDAAILEHHCVQEGANGTLAGVWQALLTQADQHLL